MKKICLLIVSSLCMGLSACSQMPKECEQSWKYMADIDKQSGIPEDSIKAQKKQFEQQIKSMSKDQAIQACQAQSAIFKMVK